MPRNHYYKAALRWVGNLGQGTRSYTSYSRDLEALWPGRASIPMSSDPAFRGDASRHSPEDLLLASLSSCHMLWYLHLASERGIVVESYTDAPEAVMQDEGAAGGNFLEATLKPRVAISSGDAAVALTLHGEAHRLCFIARSVNFPVRCEAEIHSAPAAA